MKNNRLFISLVFAVLIGICQQTFAQTIVRFDFSTGKFNPDDLKALDRLKPGGQYQVKITNINTNLYKIVINKSDTIVSPALTVPSFTGFSVSDLSGLIAGLTTGGINATVMKAVSTSTAATPSDKKSLLTDEYLPKPKVKTKTTLIPKIDPEIEKIKGFMMAFQKELEKYFATLKGINEKTDQLVFDYNKLIVNAMIQNENNGNGVYFDTRTLTLDNLKNRFDGLRNEINTLDEQVRGAAATYRNETFNYSTTIADNKQLKANDSNLTTAYKSFAKKLDTAQSSLSSSKCTSYILSIANIQNSSSREYVFAEQQFSKEQSTLTIAITPRATTNSGLTGITTTWTFPLHQRQFWAISSGFFVSTLYNQSYSTLKTTSADAKNSAVIDTSFSIKSERPAKMEFGINTMIRYGVQISDNYSYWQFGVGPGATVTDKIRARLMIGTGLAFGRTHKFLIDVGYITGYTDQLSVLYKNNLNPQVNPGTVTVSRLSSGAYLSVGYLFN